MSATTRGTFTRILPWAALALMVVFFFMQVAARNRAAAAATDAQERLRALEGTPTVPPAVSGGSDLVALREALRASEARGEQAAAEVRALTTQLERAEAVRAAQKARADALQSEGGPAAARLSAQCAALEAQLAAAQRAAVSERDLAYGASAAHQIQLAEANKQTWIVQQEADALRRALAEVHAQIEPLLRQARDNQARIAALSAAPPLGAAQWAAVSALDPLASDAAKAQHDAFVAALGEAWRQEDGRGRVAHAYAYASILGTLARTEQTATLARALVKAGNLPAATRARVATCLVRFHLKDPASTGDLLMSGDAGVRAAVLARLRAHEGGWSGSGRKHVAAVLERLLARADVRRRRDGAWGLGVLKAGAYAAPLAARLADENGDVRHAAAWALTQLKRSPATVAPLKKHAKALLASPKPADLGEGIWLAQWVLGQPQNTAWIDLSNAQLRRVAQRLRPRLDG